MGKKAIKEGKKAAKVLAGERFIAKKKVVKKSVKVRKKTTPKKTTKGNKKVPKKGK